MRLEVRDESLAAVLWDVQAERNRQDAKWGEQDHSPQEWMSVLAEEVGEAAQEGNRLHWGLQSQPEREQRWLRDYRAELVQVAAVAVAAIESLDRHKARRINAIFDSAEEDK